MEENISLITSFFIEADFIIAYSYRTGSRKRVGPEEGARRWALHQIRRWKGCDDNDEWEETKQTLIDTLKENNDSSCEEKCFDFDHRRSRKRERLIGPWKRNVVSSSVLGTDEWPTFGGRRGSLRLPEMPSSRSCVLIIQEEWWWCYHSIIPLFVCLFINDKFWKRN